MSGSVLLQSAVKFGLVGCGVGAAFGIASTLLGKKFKLNLTKSKRKDDSLQSTSGPVQYGLHELKEKHPNVCQEYDEVLESITTLPHFSNLATGESKDKLLGRLRRNLFRLARLNGVSFENSTQASDAFKASAFHHAASTDIGYLIDEQMTERDPKLDVQMKRVKTILKQWRDNVSLSIGGLLTGHQQKQKENENGI